MRKTRPSIAILLCFILLTIYVPTCLITETKAAYTPHAPIIIASDEDFVAQGWPGEGIPKDPFVIERLNITSTATCISVSNTKAVFEIRDCLLSAPTNSPNNAAVHF
nr:hypothetical protein [Candidatus Sigynarchaeota archaeon]